MAAPALGKVACTNTTKEKAEEACASETELPDCGNNKLAIERGTVVLSELGDCENDLRTLDSVGWEVEGKLTEDANPSYPHMIQVNSEYEPIASISRLFPSLGNGSINTKAEP